MLPRITGEISTNKGNGLAAWHLVLAKAVLWCELGLQLLTVHRKPSVPVALCVPLSGRVTLPKSRRDSKRWVTTLRKMLPVHSVALKPCCGRLVWAVRELCGIGPPEGPPRCATPGQGLAWIPTRP